MDSDRVWLISNVIDIAGMALPHILLIITLGALLTACSNLQFPGVHRINVQQGNVITQQMIDKLRPGMTKSQVRFVLGNAVIDDSLNIDRWDYIYTLSIAGGDQMKTKLSVYFLDERLSYFVGDFIPSEEYEAFRDNST